MPGFLAPDVLYLATAPDDRAYARELLGKLREAGGYERYVEPCVGAFGTALEAREKRWDTIETSDVSLYPSVIGCLASGRPLAELDVRVDGIPLAGASDEFAQGAAILHAQVYLRYVAQPTDYARSLAHDLEERRVEHLQALEKHLGKLVKRLAGIAYEPLDMWEHIARVKDDPRTVIFCDPPVYRGGYEKLSDTGGRLTWAEPPYELFDPKVDFIRLRELMEDAPALLVCGEQTEPGKCAHQQPTYARHVLRSEYVYAWSNRPLEVIKLMGGMRIRTRRTQEVLSLPLPLLEPDDEITDESEVALVAVMPAVARYYKDLWLHRITGAETGFAFALTIDGKLAGLASVSTTPITRPYKNKPIEKRDGILLRWVVHPPHRLRLARLLTRIAMQRPVLEQLLPPTSQLYLGMSTRVVTIEYSRHPEVKGLRGLMKLTEREQHPDGYKLTYEAAFGGDSLEQAYRVWLAGERNYATRASK